MENKALIKWVEYGTFYVSPQPSNVLHLVYFLRVGPKLCRSQRELRNNGAREDLLLTFSTVIQLYCQYHRYRALRGYSHIYTHSATCLCRGLTYVCVCMRATFILPCPHIPLCRACLIYRKIKPVIDYKTLRAAVLQKSAASLFDPVSCPLLWNENTVVEWLVQSGYLKKGRRKQLQKKIK